MLKIKPRTSPEVVSRLGPAKRVSRIAPAFACIAPGPSTPDIQHALALRIEVKKTQHGFALRGIGKAITADKLVIDHAAVHENHGAPSLDTLARAQRQARTQYQRIQQIAFKADISGTDP